MKSLTAQMCAQCKRNWPEDGLRYCRKCLDAELVRVLDARRPRITCDLRCRSMGIEVLRSGYFSCCEPQR